MTIENITTIVKFEKISSFLPEQVIALNIIVTVRKGDKLVDVELKGEIRRISKLALAKAEKMFDALPVE